MEREIKVSVIIPVYNVETYISKCISSVIEQNYKNIEIILIDDGSQDSSGKILDEYEKKDDRITVIHQKNKGVSAARNRGLELASGDYVVFVDGDDSLYIQRSHWKKSNKKIINAWKFHRYAFNWTIMGGLSRSNQECKYIEEYKKCAKSLRKNIFQAMKVKIPIKSKLMYLCIAICPYLMAKREKRKVRY